MDDLTSFYEEPGVQKDVIQVGTGIPFGFRRVTHPTIPIGGVYGTWGQSYDNGALPGMLETLLGGPVPEKERLNLSELGFVNRQHSPALSHEDHTRLEVEVGARLLREAARACGWDPSEVEAILIGMSAPITNDYLAQIARAAGIPDSALKVTVHKACDGSVSSLHLALNPDLPENDGLARNIAESVRGKKTLVGGIEGLSRFLLAYSRDTNAL